MKNTTIASIACLSAFIAVPALAQGVMTSKTLAENDKTIVAEATLKPGDTAPMASRLGTAFYYVKGGTMEITYKDGTKKTVTRDTGTARIGSDAQPYSVKNTGKTTIDVISVAAKTK